MRDNQPRHRQLAKERRKLERRKASKAGLPTALIVCEGRCTEPYYIDCLRESLGVNGANVQIDSGGTTTDASGLVACARDRFRKTRDFDHVFVVVDGDQPGLAQARAAAAAPMRKAAGGIVGIELIVSTPCFEFWLLLHFEFTTREFGSAAEVTRTLAAYLPDYEKGDRDIFAKVRSGLEQACGNAGRVNQETARTGATSPGTDMPVLVNVLRTMSGN